MSATPKTLKCVNCRHARIECRGCGRKMCHHFAKSITDGEGKLFDPLRDRPARILGTCSSCVVSGRMRP